MNKENLDLFIQAMMDNVSTGKSIFNPQNLSFRISSNDAVALCCEVLPIFKKEKTVLDLVGPINITGDIHGQLNDLVRCLILGGSPPFTRWLFLGDFVDRGPCSVEVITLLFALKIRYPNHVYLIRGNHESPEMTDMFGFRDECCRKFDLISQQNRVDSQGNQVWMSFCNVFEYIPIAAIVANDYLCIHGGISPQLERIQQIREIKRPLRIPEKGFVTDLFWSDPSKNIKEYGGSTRGSTFVWGLAPIRRFLKDNKLKCIIRGHQFVPEGFDFPFNPEKCVITLFTASNYVEGLPSLAAYLVMDKNGKYEIQKLPQTPIFTLSPSLPKENPQPSNSILIDVSDKDQNSQNSSSSANLDPNPQPQPKVRQMSNRFRAAHRRSLPIDNRPPFSAARKNPLTSGNNDVDKDNDEEETPAVVEEKASTPQPSPNPKEDFASNVAPSKRNSLTITLSNNPVSRTVRTRSFTNGNKTTNQNQSSNFVASPPTSAAKAPSNKNSNIKSNPTKKVASPPIKSNSAEILSPPTKPNNFPNVPNFNIPNLNIPNSNIHMNVGIDLSSLDENSDDIPDGANEDEVCNTAPSTPPPSSLNVKISSQSSTPSNTLEQARRPPLPSTSRVQKTNLYRTLANSRMVTEQSPLVKSAEKKRNNSASLESSMLKGTSKSVSKSSVSMTPTRKANNGLNTPPKTKQSSEYCPTPRPNISKTRTNRSRSNSLKL